MLSIFLLLLRLPLLILLQCCIQQCRNDLNKITNLLQISRSDFLPLNFISRLATELLELIDNPEDAINGLPLVFLFLDENKIIVEIWKQNRKYFQIPVFIFQHIQSQTLEFNFTLQIDLIDQIHNFCLQRGIHFKFVSENTITQWEQDNKFINKFAGMQSLQEDEKLDEDFVMMLNRIEQRYLNFNKHIQIRVEKWVEQLVKCDENLVWKRNRNNYIRLLMEMVERNWIGQMYLRMPPESGIQNLSENQYKKVMKQIRTHPKVSDSDNQLHGSVTMKKIASPHGDFGSALITPNCQTDREPLKMKIKYPLQTSAIEEVQDEQLKEHEQGKEHEQLKEQGSEQGREQGREHEHEQSNEQKNKILNKVLNFLSRNQGSLRERTQLESLLQKIREACKNSEVLQSQHQKLSETELKVEEGIDRNRANLLQFGSPRGMTQMQYYKATLQL